MQGQKTSAKSSEARANEKSKSKKDRYKDSKTTANASEAKPVENKSPQESGSSSESESDNENGKDQKFGLSKVKCHYPNCKQFGHYANECPLYLTTRKGPRPRKKNSKAYHDFARSIMLHNSAEDEEQWDYKGKFDSKVSFLDWYENRGANADIANRGVDLSPQATQVSLSVYSLPSITLMVVSLVV